MAKRAALPSRIGVLCCLIAGCSTTATHQDPDVGAGDVSPLADLVTDVRSDAPASDQKVDAGNSDHSAPDAATFKTAAVTMISGPGLITAKALAVGPSGAVYLTGFFTESLTVGTSTITSNHLYDIFIARFDPGGKPGWIKRVGGIGDDTVGGIAVDSIGNAYICGKVSSKMTLGGKQVYGTFTAKFSPGGSPIWATDTGGTLSSSPGGIAIWAKGPVVTGSLWGKGTFGVKTVLQKPLSNKDVFVISLADTGGIDWVITNGAPYSSASGEGVAVDAAGNVLFTGYFSGTLPGVGKTTGSSADAFVAKLTHKGAPVWARVATGKDSVAGRRIVVDAAGAAHVTGGFKGTATFGTHTLTAKGSGSGYATKISSGGAVVWAVATTSSSQNWVADVALNSAGVPFIAGATSGALTLGAATFPGSGNLDGFIAKLSPTGSPVAAIVADGDQPLYINALASSGKQLFVTGQVNGKASLGSRAITAGPKDAFLWILTQP